MPRNPAAKKNQHNNRHENGLVGPGKRVTKQKSNGHLNGNVKPPVPDEPIPITSHVDHYAPSTTATTTAYAAPSSDPELQSTLIKRDSESSTDGDGRRWENNANETGSTSLRRSDMAPQRTKSLQEVNTAQIASTILRSSPAGDTISLLIALLALPPLLLTSIQGAFTILTAVPPSNVSPISFLSLFDVFQGSAGSPSYRTMGAVDVFCFGVWICLWTWAQNFTLDLAQIQIAMTLGNGNSSKSRSVNVFCLAMVLVMHLLRSGGVRRFVMTKVVPDSISTHPVFANLAQYLPSEDHFGGDPGQPSKIWSLFAIHILSQALMAFVRRHISSTQINSNSRSTKRIDTEAYPGSSNTPEPLDLDAAKAVASGVDFPAPPTPGLKDPKDKAVSAKKRKRQANQVRSRQPFWAALASTKVLVLRDSEQSSGHKSGRSDTRLSLPSQIQDSITITHVEASSIDFEAYITNTTDLDYEGSVSADTKPIFVRINGALWSISLEPAQDDTASRNRWFGTIAGLAPDCTYTCSFSRENDEEFFSVMVKTPALQDKDIAQSSMPAPVRTSLRPHSPTTTLRTSIHTAEAKLAEARARLTKTRRTHRAGVSRIEKDVDSYNTRLKSSSDDTRQRQKLLQAERSIQQTESANEEISTMLEELEAVPEDDLVDYDKTKGSFEDKSKVLAKANEALAAARSEAKAELSCITSELNNIVSRKERLQGRQVKLAEQHDRITQANAQGINEKERKAQESARIAADRQRREKELNDGINQMYNETQELQSRTSNHWREIDALEKQAYAQREAMMKQNGPLTPEGNLPGTNHQAARAFNFGPYQPSALAFGEAQSTPFLPFAKAVPADARRPRSNTNRSLGAISNFSADAFEDADPIPPMPSNLDYDILVLNGRKSSGSSRGKNNGSPAGAIGDGIRGPHKNSPIPGGMPGISTW